MIQIDNKYQCSGCTACYTVCPKRAIAMAPDNLGFKYPVIDSNLCIDCKMCEKVCPFIQDKEEGAPIKVYAARSNSTQDLQESRSGGVFPALYKTIIAGGGRVYGALFDENLNVRHQSADSEETCKLFRGSKYVQSELDDVFQSVVGNLKAGLKVLFSGTPCQVAGLLKIVPPHLSRELYTVDIICHGVPSPKLYKDYITFIERTNDSKVVAFNFRDKLINGWHDHKESAILENGNKIVDTLYTRLFYTNCFFRESCYACPFASTHRVADITLGDLWGWERIDKTLNDDDMGISLVFVNSEKGKHLLDKSMSYVTLKKVELEQCIQRNLKMPTPLPFERQVILSIYYKSKMEGIIEYLYHPTIKTRLINKIKKLFNGKKN